MNKTILNAALGALLAIAGWELLIGPMLEKVQDKYEDDTILTV